MGEKTVFILFYHTWNWDDTAIKYLYYSHNKLMYLFFQ